MTIKIEITGETPAEIFKYIYDLANIDTHEVEPIAPTHVSEAQKIKNLHSSQLAENLAALTEEVVQPVEEHGDAELDAHGHPWSADLHASTKGKTKEGLWRMKPGATRPDPKPGFPIEDVSTSTESTGETESTPSEVAPIEDAAPTEPAPTEDDEFAAFRAADAKLAEQDAAAVASIPARKFTDADLSAVCNQAAVKLGDPAPVKALIAEFVPEGEIQHSRMIPDAKRADFVAAVEAKAGIEFAG
jgi:hypothetical protein